MTTEQLNTALYNKMYAEQEQFKSMLHSSSPEVVMQHSYELVMREDIICIRNTFQTRKYGEN